MYKDILVYLDPSSDTASRLRVATKLARLHDARLLGMEACSAEAFEGEWLERTTQLPDLFQEAIKLGGVKGHYVTIDRWKRAGRHEYAHYADLIVASQPEVGAKKLLAAGIPEDVLLSAGVPILLLPTGWRERSIGERIMIAWKSNREATRAVHDAMPFLTRAQKVIAFTFGPAPDGSGDEPELAGWASSAARGCRRTIEVVAEFRRADARGCNVRVSRRGGCRSYSRGRLRALALG